MAEGTLLPAYFGADYVSAYVACKSKELEAFEAEMSPAEFSWYLLAD
jgi:glutamine synthetase